MKKSERIAELERKVAELEKQVAALNAKPYWFYPINPSPTVAPSVPPTTDRIYWTCEGQVSQLLTWN